MLTARTKTWIPEERNTGSVDIKNFNANGDTTYSFVLANLPVSKITRSMEGQNIQHFHARKKRGELLPSTFYKRVDNTQVFKSLAYSWSKAGLGSGYQTQTGGQLPPSLENEILNRINTLDAQYYLQQASARMAASWDALTFAAEVGSLIRSFSTYAQRMLSLRHPATLGELWLDARYNWRPLILDFQDLRQGIKELIQKRERFTESAGITYSTSSTDVVSSIIFDQAAADVERNLELKVGLRGTITCDYEKPFVAMSPILTTWELVPYSFLIDQLIDIGNLLRSLLFMSNVRALTCATGYKVSALATYRYINVRPINSGFTVNLSQSLESRCAYTLRTPQTFNPTLKIGMLGNITHLVDILAIAVGIIFRFRQQPSARVLAYS